MERSLLSHDITVIIIMASNMNPFDNDSISNLGLGTPLLKLLVRISFANPGVHVPRANPNFLAAHALPCAKLLAAWNSLCTRNHQRDSRVFQTLHIQTFPIVDVSTLVVVA